MIVFLGPALKSFSSSSVPLTMYQIDGVRVTTPRWTEQQWRSVLSDVSIDLPCEPVGKDR